MDMESLVKLNEELGGRLDQELIEISRYRWLEENVKETIYNPRGYNSEIAPDCRLKWEIPTLISYTAIGSAIPFGRAVDLAMTASKKSHC